MLDEGNFAPSTPFVVIRVSAWELNKTWVVPHFLSFPLSLSLFTVLIVNPPILFHCLHTLAMSSTHIALPSHTTSLSSSRRLVRLSLTSSRRQIRSVAAAVDARIAALRAEYALHPRFGRKVEVAFSNAGSRLPRARPSSAGSQVKHSFTFDFGGYAVPAATIESMRKSFDPSNLWAVH